MNFKKIAAHYELMKLADAFQGLVKKYADEQQAQPVQPEQVKVSILSERTKSIIYKANADAKEDVTSRYTLTYTQPKGDAKYTLLPEFRNQYTEVPPGPTADPYYPFNLNFKSGASIWTASGQLYQNTGYDSSIILNITPSVKNPSVFIQKLDINALKNEIAATVTKRLIEQGKLLYGQVIPTKIIQIQVNGNTV